MIGVDDDVYSQNKYQILSNLVNSIIYRCKQVSLEFEVNNISECFLSFVLVTYVVNTLTEECPRWESMMTTMIKMRVRFHNT